MNEQEKIPLNYFINLILPYKFFIAGCLVIFLGLAWVYLKTQPNQYSVKATMLLSLDKSNNIDINFLGQEENFSPYMERDDEIGYMTSYTFIRKTVLRLDAGISYYQKKWLANLPKSKWSNPYYIKVDSTHKQLVDIPIFVIPAGDKKVTVRVDASSAWAYMPNEFGYEEEIEDVYLEETIRIGDFVETPFLKFQVVPL
jgi:hypothetical protein